MKTLLTTLLAALLLTCPALADGHGKHLFVLSGQSNMAGLNPEISFTPTVVEAFGKDKVIVVKSAQGGQPIRRWYKKWKDAEGNAPEKTGDLYDVLMQKVNAAKPAAAQNGARVPYSPSTPPIIGPRTKPAPKAAPTRPGERFPIWLMALNRCVTHRAPASA